MIRLPAVGSAPSLRPLGPLAVAVLLFAVCDLVHANQFLAAFVAGATIATLSPDVSDSYRHTGELVSETVKGAALVAFASLVDVSILTDAGWAGLLLAVLVIGLCRPLPVMLSLTGARLDRRERLSVAWFGPKGFASIAYAVIVAFSGMDLATEVLSLTTVTVLVSILAHSSTDVAVARALSNTRREGGTRTRADAQHPPSPRAGQSGP